MTTASTYPIGPVPGDDRAAASAAPPAALAIPPELSGILFAALLLAVAAQLTVKALAARRTP